MQQIRVNPETLDRSNNRYGHHSIQQNLVSIAHNGVIDREPIKKFVILDSTVLRLVLLKSLYELFLSNPHIKLWIVESNVQVIG